MTARRSTRLLLAPAVLALLALAALMGAGGKPRGALVAVAAGIYWLVSAVADYSKRLVITDEQLRMSGYVGRAVTVHEHDKDARAQGVLAARDAKRPGHDHEHHLDLHRSGADHGISR